MTGNKHGPGKAPPPGVWALHSGRMFGNGPPQRVGYMPALPAMPCHRAMAAGRGLPPSGAGTSGSGYHRAHP